MLDSLLDQLARQRGIGDAYHNYRGELLHISRETKTAILAAMGCATSDAAAIERELHELETGRLRSLLPPVAVVHPHRNNVTLAVPADSLSREIAWHIATECGTEVSGRVRAGELPEHERREVDGRWLTRRDLLLPGSLPHGYHTLHVALDGGASETCALVGAPLICHEPGILHDGGRLWGVAVQLVAPCRRVPPETCRHRRTNRRDEVLHRRLGAVDDECAVQVFEHWRKPAQASHRKRLVPKSFWRAELTHR